MPIIAGTDIQNRSKTKLSSLDGTPIAHAVRLIHQVCCFAGAFDLVEDFRDPALAAAVDWHDSGALFDRLMNDFSFQGISDQIASNYIARHGQATWTSVCKNLARRPSCLKLQSYWHFHDCRYEKTSGTCAEPDHIAVCPVPSHRLRNGHLNQIAYSFYLFIRDVADGDLVGWIDDRLDQASNDEVDPDRLITTAHALIEPLRNVYGVSDKVLAMAFSGILIGAADVRPKWLQVGLQLIAVDTLVHNFLTRTGILGRFKATHPYGPSCYRPGGCAEPAWLSEKRRPISMEAPSELSATTGQWFPGPGRSRQQNRRTTVNRSFPQVFPRFVQLAIWRYCSQEGLDICNGNRVDDRQRCQNRYCRLHDICDRICLDATRF